MNRDQVAKFYDSVDPHTYTTPVRFGYADAESTDFKHQLLQQMERKAQGSK